MKILLTTLNSKYIHSNLAVKYLYMSAIDYRRQLTLREFTINNDPDYIFTEIVRGDYHAVCFSCYIWNVDMTMRLAKNIKKAQPNIKIVLGGPEVSFDSVEIMKKNRFVDFIIRGEGEGVFPAFLKQLLGRGIYKNVRGILYRDMGKIYVNPQGEPMDFNEVPFPYGYIQPEKDKIIYYESSRGCPFRCSFCLSSVEKHVRTLPFERVKKELKYFLLQKVKQVKFIDRTFNFDRDRCNRIISYIINHDNGVTNFHFEICGELIDDRFIELMKEARPGLFQVEIGVQSLNPTTLEAVNRGKNRELLLYNAKRLIDLGTVHVHLDLIAGLPYEDYLTFMESFNGVYELRPMELQLGFLKLLKGTRIRDEKEKYGYVFRQEAPYQVIANRFISADGIARLKMVENVLDLYYNRGGFTRTLEYAVGKLRGTAFDLYEELAYFFYLKGYQNRSHKKEDLYRIFFQYALWKDRSLPGVAEEVRKLLTADMEDTLNPEAVKKFNKKGWDFGK